MGYLEWNKAAIFVGPSVDIYVSHILAPFVLDLHSRLRSDRIFWEWMLRCSFDGAFGVMEQKRLRMRGSEILVRMTYR